MWRLVRQGTDLHVTGRLTVRLDDAAVAACREFGERIGDDAELGKQAIARAEAVFDGPGMLPECPDEAAAEAWLLRVRAAYYAAGS